LSAGQSSFPTLSTQFTRRPVTGRRGELPAMSEYVPTLYKARNFPTKQVACCICVERTRGRTQKLTLGYGVEIWLCKAHASAEFQRQRNGRDFELTLMRLWRAHGCWTLARQKALRAFRAAHEAAKQPRHRPGSYAWPDLRRRAERAYANGAHPEAIKAYVDVTFRECPARLPSRRTLRRWHAERRWIGPG